MQAFWIKLSSYTFYKIQNPKRERKSHEKSYKCLKSNLVQIKMEKKERSEQFYMKEHHAVAALFSMCWSLL